jgi:hypothetical protein
MKKISVEISTSKRLGHSVHLRLAHFPSVKRRFCNIHVFVMGSHFVSMLVLFCLGIAETG